MRGTLIGSAVLVAMVGCAGDEGPPGLEAEPLLLADGWQLTPEEDDLYAERRPAGQVCARGGVEVEALGEDTTLSVRTGLCNYPTLSQPLLLGLEPDDRVEVSLWHFELSAPEPGEAYASLGWVGERRWETRVPVPAEAALVREQFVVPEAVEAGSEVQFHLGNHGANSWNLISVLRLR